MNCLNVEYILVAEVQILEIISVYFFPKRLFQGVHILCIFNVSGLTTA